MNLKALVSAMGISVALTGCGGGGGGSSGTSSAGCTPTMANPLACTAPAATDTTAGAPAAAIVFDAADTTNIALVGTGGIGRQEFSTLRFKVLDASGKPTSGAQVSFEFADVNNGGTATVGGLKLLPATATSGADGFATTVVSGGTIPTSIRIKATVNGITTLSNVLVVSTGVPTQEHFSLATSKANCEGLNFDQECTTVTVTLGDHFGNPVPDGTAVSFKAEGGIIDASCLTGRVPAAGTTPTGQTTNSQQLTSPIPGTCSVTLRSGSPRPPNGRVTVLAYALGEEDFFDADGNNRCDNCDDSKGQEFTAAHDRSPDIFHDANEDGIWTTGEACIGPNRNGSCSTPGDGKYNGVLRNPPSSGTAQTVYIAQQAVVLFSGSYATVTTATGNPLTCPANGSVDAYLWVRDQNGNPLPAGTRIELSTSFAGSVTPSSHVVGSYPLAVAGMPPYGALVYRSNITCPAAAGAAGNVFVKVTTPNNVVTNESLPITFQ